MNKAYKYRIYPTKEQKDLFNKTFFAVRYVYNLALETQKTIYELSQIDEKRKRYSAFDLSKQLTELKKQAGCEFLNDVHSIPLIATLRNLDLAYKNFFRGLKRGVVGFPKFKNKHQNSFQFHQGCQIISDKKLFIPKAGLVSVVMHRPFEGEIKTCTISKTPSGKFYISMLSEQPDETVINLNEAVIGIDVGIKYFAVLSNGEIIENPRFLNKELRQLKRLSKRLSRKQKGSRNRNKSRYKLAKLHERVANQRNDFLNNCVDTITKKARIICVEDLQVRNMIKNTKLSRHIADVGWGMFFEKLTKKCMERGVDLVEVGKFEPTSKICNYCGNKNKELKLSDRAWTCENCGQEIERDLNAAKNIRDVGYKMYLEFKL